MSDLHTHILSSWTHRPRFNVLNSARLDKPARRTASGEIRHLMAVARKSVTRSQLMIDIVLDPDRFVPEGRDLDPVEIRRAGFASFSVPENIVEAEWRALASPGEAEDLEVWSHEFAHAPK